MNGSLNEIKTDYHLGIWQCHATRAHVNNKQKMFDLVKFEFPIFSEFELKKRKKGEGNWSTHITQ